MKKKTFWNLIDETFKKVEKPMSAKELWEKAEEYGITENFETNGNTPWQTIGAYLYTDINDKEESKYCQTSKRPTRFATRNIIEQLNISKFNIEIEKEDEKEEKKREKNKPFNERDLHPLIVAFANTHFKAHLKTIHHEKSKKQTKGLNEWLHPDLIGVYFPFKEYEKETVEIQKDLSISSVKLFSYELKINLTFKTLRQYYFQAVSNSSWANEGYLVTLNIADDPTLFDEIRRLNNAFGIGVIKINAKNIFESQILFPAKEKADIDWDTVNRLANESNEFKDFLKNISDDIKICNVKSEYDEKQTPEKIENYIIDKKITNS